MEPAVEHLLAECIDIKETRPWVAKAKPRVVAVNRFEMSGFLDLNGIDGVIAVLVPGFNEEQRAVRDR